MCGIYGYIGSKNGARVVIEGLKKLEYRGYDSAGIATVLNGQLQCFKEIGKVSSLARMVDGLNAPLAIAHTRWATHGKPNRINAHPQTDTAHSVALIHNGIVENDDILRQRLRKEGVRFVSDTDTEVIVQLIARCYKGNFLDSVQEAISFLQGSWALAVVHKNHPNEIIVSANGCPLVIGMGADESYVSSDPNALPSSVQELIYLSDGEVAAVQSQEVAIFDTNQIKISKQKEQFNYKNQEASKGAFEHFTLKEIFEQPQTLRSAMLSRFVEEYGSVTFEDCHFSIEDFAQVKRIIILACGTSWNAGFLAQYMIEDKARIPVQIEISSEFRYKNPVLSEGTLAIAISQSGETADTIAAVRELKAKGAKVLSICNVHNSTLAREADGCIFLRAGPEIGVCSTKAFTSQLVVLSLLTVLLARLRHMSKKEGQDFLHALKNIPDQVQEILNKADEIQHIASKYIQYDHFFFLGRRYMYPTCLEGALKLKEIAYVNANGYPAGEMKHGPIALIHEACPTIAFCSSGVTYDKMLSNLQEVKARGGKIIAISADPSPGLTRIANDIIWVPQTLDELSPILHSVIAQLFAYYFALMRGTEIDQPRNLAKSVTVE